MAGNRIAVVGVGYSTTGRSTGLTSRQLALQAGLAALDDAGMTTKDIDGVAMCWSVAGPAPDGVEAITGQDVAHMMGMRTLTFDSSGGIVFMSSMRDAIMAVQSGQCTTAMAFRVINQRKSVKQMVAPPSGASPRIGDDIMYPTLPFGGAQFYMPFGQVLPVQANAMLAQRYLDVYGRTEADFAIDVVTQRYHASLNPDALFREQITEEDYYASRMISTPLRILDCDYPVDSASAVIVTTEDRARDWQKKPVFFEATAYTMTWDAHHSPETVGDDSWNSPTATAELLWRRTDLRPHDVDTVQLYDGFTYIPFLWLEAFGFCKPGEAGDLVRSAATRLGGALPMNTDGGARNAGRRHGANFCIESVKQLRGECGDRQVPDAQVALWTNGYWWSALMTAD